MSYRIEIREVVDLPVGLAFERLADHNRLGAILGLPCRRTRDGDTEVNGVGSVRTLGFWPLDFDETVTACDPGQRIDYRITRGSPLRNHRGSVRFAPAGRGTEVNWSIHYQMRLPLIGAVLKQVLSVGIRRGLRKLK